MSHAHRYVHLTEQLQTTERMIAEPRYSEHMKKQLRDVRTKIVTERNNLMDAIEFGVVDDSEGI